MVVSCTLPAVSRTTSSRPAPSERACTLVVSPPRDRPMAWSPGSPITGSSGQSVSVASAVGGSTVGCSVSSIALLGPVPRIFAEPQDDRRDDQGGAEVGGSFGVAGGQAAELLEPGETAFDDVAPGVDGLVAGRCPAAGGAFVLAA